MHRRVGKDKGERCDGIAGHAQPGLRLFGTGMIARIHPGQISRYIGPWRFAVQQGTTSVYRGIFSIPAGASYMIRQPIVRLIQNSTKRLICKERTYQSTHECVPDIPSVTQPSLTGRHMRAGSGVTMSFCSSIQMICGVNGGALFGIQIRNRNGNARWFSLQAVVPTQDEFFFCEICVAAGS